MNIAMTTLSSKILTGDKLHFARLAVDAILRLKGATGDLDKGGFLRGRGGNPGRGRSTLRASCRGCNPKAERCSRVFCQRTKP
eukprot:400094-Pelagomonas_calceolata.AAC.2